MIQFICKSISAVRQSRDPINKLVKLIVHLLRTNVFDLKVLYFIISMKYNTKDSATFAPSLINNNLSIPFSKISIDYTTLYTND